MLKAHTAHISAALAECWGQSFAKTHGTERSTEKSHDKEALESISEE